ncbi:peroxisomal N1-acetyl-spermine/spermidine oxidase, partial [Danaus plexippus plexippus]
KSESAQQCDVCTAYYLTAENLSAHRKLHLNAYRCTECGLVSCVKRVMSAHDCAKRAERYSCADCDLMFRVLPQNKNGTSKEPVTIPCKGCDKVFHSKKSYRAHVVIHDNQSYPCPTCGKLFQWKRNLARHARNHRERAAGTTHACHACGKTFASRDCYNNHMRLSKKHVHENSETSQEPRLGDAHEQVAGEELQVPFLPSGLQLAHVRVQASQADASQESQASTRGERQRTVPGANCHAIKYKTDNSVLLFHIYLQKLKLKRHNKVNQKYDTIVIGLGSAGATAASTLAKAGKRVLALEAQDRVGGRVHTVQFGDGVVELGAEWLHGTHPSIVYEDVQRNNISLVPQEFYLMTYKSDGTRGNDVLINELEGLCFDDTINLAGPNMPAGFNITQKIQAHIKENYPELENDREFMDEVMPFLNLVVNNHESSNDWNDVSSRSRYTELDGPQYLSWHKQGYHSFFDILLNKYNNGPGWPTLDVKLNTEVTLIKWPKDSTGDVEVKCVDGSEYKADNVIVTVSVGVLKDRKTLRFQPELPPEKIKAINVIPIGVMNKIILKFEKLDLPRGVFYGFLWKSEDRARVSVEDRWTTQIFGVSTPTGTSNTITLWTSGTIGLLVESMPSDVVMKKSMELIRKFMAKVADIPEPTGILMSKWFSNPFTRGSYSYDNTVVADYPDARATLEAPLRDSAGALKVLFAGEATHPIYFSTVHGASETGLKTAERLLSNITL